MIKDSERVFYRAIFEKLLDGEPLGKTDFIRFCTFLEGVALGIDNTSAEEFAGMQLRLRNAVTRFMPQQQ